MGEFLKNREMMTVTKIRNYNGVQYRGALQMSILSPVMCVICINNMMEGVTSNNSFFVDDLKLLR